MAERYDAVVVGAGPNGLAAAIRLARAGLEVLVVEAAGVVGGGTRSRELTLPGYRHDVCSAIHPLAAGSPFFAELPLQEYGLEWVYPEAPLAHPLDDGTAVVVERDSGAMGAQLGGRDGRAWRLLFGPLERGWPDLRDALLGPLLRVPRHPLVMGWFGVHALLPATVLARTYFRGARARAAWAGVAAHSFMPLQAPTTAAFGLILGVTCHTVSWPMARGGSQALADALAGLFRASGGEIRTGFAVTSLRELPRSQAVVCDLTPRQLVAIAGDRLPPGRRARLERFRYGPGVFKLDYALDGPVPWRAPAVMRAGTVHLGGTLEQIAASEWEVSRGRHPDRPYVLVAQHSQFDPTRAPAGKHTLWAYCHVPNGSTVDMTDRVEAQLERFAPGFRDRVLARHAMNCAELEAYNANYIGGDIGGGANGGLQSVARPRLSPDPYRVSERIWLCSASTPPGGGVHGMCGYHAAGSVLEALRTAARTVG